jgi:hypothetical protein
MYIYRHESRNSSGILLKTYRDALRLHDLTKIMISESKFIVKSWTLGFRVSVEGF